MKNTTFRFIQFICIVVSVIGLITKCLDIVGGCIIFNSLATCFCVRKHNRMIILFLLMAYINCSVGWYDCILGGEYASMWQQNGMRATESIINTAKSILITCTILLLFVTPFISKNTSRFFNNLEKYRSKNSFIILTFIAILSGILLFALFSEVLPRQMEGYSSVTNPLFEYSSIFVLFLWYFSKDVPIVDKFIKLYTIIFCILFALIGDRSSCFIMLLLVFILYFSKNISFLKLAVVAFAGIYLANFISQIRADKSFIEAISIAIERGFYTDTVSWSYYASITISALHKFVDEPWRFIFGNLFYYLTGISTTYSGMSGFARDYSSNLYNIGGGIYSSYFYGMSGYIGVVCGALILGIIIRKAFKSSSFEGIIYQCLLVTLSLRWYLYSISTLFRGILVLTTILLLLCRLLNSKTKRKVLNEYKIINR